MKSIDVIFVRIYVTESSNLLNKISHYLKDEAKLRGISVFRAISGFGDSGNRTSSIVDLSFNLPIVIEFFDTNEKIEPALAHLSTLIKDEHIVFWNAKANIN